MTVEEVTFALKAKDALLKNYEARTVFAFILGDLHTFDPTPPSTMEQATLRAYGMRLLRIMGITHESNMDLLLQTFRDLPIGGAVDDQNPEED